MKRRRTVRVFPEADGHVIASRHHHSALLLSFRGDPELDRYYIAAMARTVLEVDFARRRGRVREGQKRKR